MFIFGASTPASRRQRAPRSRIAALPCELITTCSFTVMSRPILGRSRAGDGLRRGSADFEHVLVTRGALVGTAVPASRLAAERSERGRRDAEQDAGDTRSGVGVAVRDPRGMRDGVAALEA